MEKAGGARGHAAQETGTAYGPVAQEMGGAHGHLAQGTGAAYGTVAQDDEGAYVATAQGDEGTYGVAPQDDGGAHGGAAQDDRGDRESGAQVDGGAHGGAAQDDGGAYEATAQDEGDVFEDVAQDGGAARTDANVTEGLREENLLTMDPPVVSNDMFGIANQEFQNELLEYRLAAAPGGRLSLLEADRPRGLSVDVVRQVLEERRRARLTWESVLIGRAHQFAEEEMNAASGTPPADEIDEELLETASDTLDPGHTSEDTELANKMAGLAAGSSGKGKGRAVDDMDVDADQEAQAQAAFERLVARRYAEEKAKEKKKLQEHNAAMKRRVALQKRDQESAEATAARHRRALETKRRVEAAVAARLAAPRSDDDERNALLEETRLLEEEAAGYARRAAEVRRGDEAVQRALNPTAPIVPIMGGAAPFADAIRRAGPSRQPIARTPGPTYRPPAIPRPAAGPAQAQTGTAAVRAPQPIVQQAPIVVGGRLNISAFRGGDLRTWMRAFFPEARNRGYTGEALQTQLMQLLPREYHSAAKTHARRGVRMDPAEDTYEASVTESLLMRFGGTTTGDQPTYYRALFEKRRWDMKTERVDAFLCDMADLFADYCTEAAMQPDEVERNHASVLVPTILKSLPAKVKSIFDPQRPPTYEVLREQLIRRVDQLVMEGDVALKGALTNAAHAPANSIASASNSGKRRADGKDDATVKKIRNGAELCPWEQGLKGCIKAECPYPHLLEETRGTGLQFRALLNQQLGTQLPQAAPPTRGRGRGAPRGRGRGGYWVYQPDYQQGYGRGRGYGHPAWQAPPDGPAIQELPADPQQQAPNAPAGRGRGGPPPARGRGYPARGRGGE
jgi:hypothetical protein